MLTTLVTSSRAAGLSVQSFALLCAEAPGVSIQFDFIEISVVFISVIDVFFFPRKCVKKKKINIFILTKLQNTRSLMFVK